MAITCFKSRDGRDRVSGDEIEFRADVAALLRVDAIAFAGRSGEAAATRSRDGIKTVVGIGEPERVAFGHQRQTGQRLDRACDANIVDVLKRDQVHVAIKLVIRWKKI